jgi:rubrerythrin
VEITARELRHLASDVDDMHREAMRDFREQAADLHRDAVRAARSRRGLLRDAGVAGLGGALLATAGPIAPFARLLPAAAQGGLTDTKIAGYAQGVELAAVEAYKAAAGVLSAATKPVGELFARHHQEHADAFGSVAGADKASGPNRKLIAAVKPQLDKIRDEKGALEFARVLENQAAYTYAAALTLLQQASFAAATATILPIESQHATVLSIALGMVDPDSLFPTGAFESSSLGDGTDPKAGLDPAKFA